MRNPFLDLISDVDVGASSSSTFWATVVATNPLRVQRDAEQMLGVTPKTLERLELGDRVLCLRDQRQLIVLGKMGGVTPPAPAYPAPNRVTIDGTDYLLSGSVKPPAFTWARTDGAVYSTTVSMPIPYTPPFPYTFNWSMQESSGYSYAANAERFPTGGTQNVRLMQIASASTTAISRLQWQLVNA